MSNSIIQRASCQPYEVAASGSVKDNLIAQSHLQTQKMSDNYFLEVTKTSARLIYLESILIFMLYETISGVWGCLLCQCLWPLATGGVGFCVMNLSQKASQNNYFLVSVKM